MADEITEPVDGGSPPVDTTPNEQAPPADDARQPEPADGAPSEEGQGEAKSSWPDDWREQLAGGDEAFLKQLKRYSSPSTFAKGFKEREDLIRSGKLKQAKPEGGDEKALAAWRKENGIPDDATGYTVPEDVQKFLTDGDKPIVATWFEEAHAAGFNQEQAQKGLEWYAKTIGALEEQRAAADSQAHDACEDTLRKEWSHAEFKANNQLAVRYLASTPLGEKWADLRTADGRRLGDDPQFIMWAADQGRQQFGDVVFASGDAERAHNSRKAEIETILKTDIRRYYAEGLDKEYSEILQREEKRGKR